MNYSSLRPLVFKLDQVSESSAGHVKAVTAGPHHQTSWFSRSGLGPKNLLWFLDTFPDVGAAGLKKHWYIEKNIRSRSLETLPLVLALFSLEHEALAKSLGLSFLICKGRVVTAALSDLLLL